MRKILFRGKRLDASKWVYGDLKTCLTPKGSMTKCPAIGTIDGTIGTFFVHPETVGQFTGLLDHNGQEIYEGDIVLCKGKHIYEVQWISDGFVMRGKTYGGITSIKSFLRTERQVIGNIHDNPELCQLPR